VDLRESEASCRRSTLEGPFLDSTIAKSIENTLKFVGKATLYDFLDLTSNARLSTLSMRAREINVELCRMSVKDANRTARMELVGFCLSLFKSDEQRAKYDNTLTRQRSS